MKLYSLSLSNMQIALKNTQDTVAQLHIIMQVNYNKGSDAQQRPQELQEVRGERSERWNSCSTRATFSKEGSSIWLERT